ncbi:pimeloyl-ACP methyl ester esterase BioH, partial [Salmonella enterica subsp. enterica serovar Infantis]
MGWQPSGEGNCHLVLRPGWGLNAEVWHCSREERGSHFTLHLVDLPGYGRRSGFGAMTFEEMTAHVAQNAPDQAIWL